MNQTILEHLNNRVKVNDILYFLGFLHRSKRTVFLKSVKCFSKFVWMSTTKMATSTLQRVVIPPREEDQD